MHFELVWTAAADEAMTELEGDQTRADVAAALRRTLGRLEPDPYDPRLGTRMFVSAGFEHVRATPVRHRDWWVLWTHGPEEGTLLVVHVGEASI